MPAFERDTYKVMRLPLTAGTTKVAGEQRQRKRQTQAGALPRALGKELQRARAGVFSWVRCWVKDSQKLGPVKGRVRRAREPELERGAVLLHAEQRLILHFGLYKTRSWDGDVSLLHRFGFQIKHGG